MSIKINGLNLQKRIINGQEVEKVMYNGQQIRPDVVPPTVDYLCFTGTAGSSIALAKIGNPNAVNLEISYDKTTWSDYTIGVQINYDSNINKVYFRNKSTTPTDFSEWQYPYNDYYKFYMSGSITGSGDITTLLCKTGTTTLTSNGCFYLLFQGCTSLTTPPRLPATSLVDYCYYYMFDGCSGLTSLPELPATTLSYGCYLRMFSYCTSLTTVPTLPALTLATSCYYEMFRGCTSIISLPELPATSLPVACYMGMFNECASIKLSDTQGLEYQIPYIIPAGGDGTDDTNSLYDMFANTGGTVSTPIINQQYYLSTDNEIVGDFDYLCFTANTGGSTIQFNGSSSHNINMPQLQYSYDKESWTDYFGDSYGHSEIVTLTNAGDKVYFRNKSKTIVSYNTSYHQNTFAITGSISASGDVGFMLSRYSTNVMPSYCFRYLFSGCALTTAPRLPATTLGSQCYYYMFNNCASLTVAPELPATNINSQCYSNMFSGCTSLTTAPELPALTVYYGSYQGMFSSCHSLVAAPSLPATTLGAESYRRMFYGCHNLETLPALPATTIPDECYYEMFAYCSKIKLSTQNTGEYITPYMIPSNGGGTTTGGLNLYQMFRNTGGDVTYPSINTQYFTSNDVI